jgi:hypothetical protein
MIRTQMGTHDRSENDRSCMECFVRYHPVTVTSGGFKELLKSP